MFLWEHYGDPNIPPFPKELIPPVVADTSSDEITPPIPIAPTDLVPATDALDSVQQDPLCLSTLPSCDDFLLALVGLFMESHIEDVGDILDDIHLLFKVNSIAAVTYSTLQGTLCLPSDHFLPNISALLLESHTTFFEDLFDDLPLLFAENNSSIVVARAHSDHHIHSLHDQSS